MARGPRTTRPPRAPWRQAAAAERRAARTRQALPRCPSRRHPRRPRATVGPCPAPDRRSSSPRDRRGSPSSRRLPPRGGGGARARRRPGARAQHVDVGRPLHARAHERPQVLRRRRSSSTRRWTGGAVGEVVASRADGLAEGDTVLHQLGWREYARARRPRRRARSTPSWRRRRPTSACSGMPGLTAYVGLLRHRRAARGRRRLRLRRGGRGRLAWRARSPRLRGHTVIGSAGSPEKVAHLTGELGFDAALRLPRRRRSPASSRAAAPDGIDVYFDNVGGEHLEAALGRAQPHGRVAHVRRDLAATTRPSPPPGPAQPRRRGRQAPDAARLHRQRPRRPHAAFAEEVGGLAARGAHQVPRDDRGGRSSGRRRRSSACCAARTPARCSCGWHKPVAHAPIG